MSDLTPLLEKTRISKAEAAECFKSTVSKVIANYKAKVGGTDLMEAFTFIGMRPTSIGKPTDDLLLIDNYGDIALYVKVKEHRFYAVHRTPPKDKNA